MTIDGIINLNKPVGITSAGCVYEIRKLTGAARVGHGGTLDPQASGVLPVCIGNAARATEYFDLDFKKYRCGMVLGLITETQDIWGEVISDRREELKSNPLSREMVAKAFDSYKGLICQRPPKYSAVKVNGRRLYEYARAGEPVEIRERKVFIEDLTVKEIDLDDNRVIFETTCSKGTYIRTICSDVGERLGCGGAMTDLVRLASGIFAIEDAVPLADLKKLGGDRVMELLRPVDHALSHFGKAVISGEESALRFINGIPADLRDVTVESEPEYAAAGHPAGLRDEYGRAYNMYAMLDDEMAFLGAAFYDDEKEAFKADKIFFRRPDR